MIGTKCRDVFGLAPRVFKSAVLDQCVFCATVREAYTEANKRNVKRTLCKLGEKTVTAFSHFVSGSLG